MKPIREFEMITNKQKMQNIIKEIEESVKDISEFYPSNMRWNKVMDIFMEELSMEIIGETLSYQEEIELKTREIINEFQNFILYDDTNVDENNVFLTGIIAKEMRIKTDKLDSYIRTKANEVLDIRIKYRGKLTKSLSLNRTITSNKDINMCNKRLMFIESKNDRSIDNIINMFYEPMDMLIMDMNSLAKSIEAFEDKEEFKNECTETKIKYDKLFNQRDMIKFLESNGFTYKNTGRHANYTNGVNTIPVPVHGSKGLGYGLQRKIQKNILNKIN